MKNEEIPINDSGLVTSCSPTRFDVFLSAGVLKTGVSGRSVFRQAKLESPDATLPSHPGQGVTVTWTLPTLLKRRLADTLFRRQGAA